MTLIVEHGVVILAAFLAAFCAVGLYRNVALKQHWFDQPNARSSHTIPTPSGSGVVIATVFVCLLVWLVLSHRLSFASASLGAMAAALGVVGWLDDRFGLSRRVRAFAFAVCSSCLAFLLLPSGVPVALFCLIFVFSFINVFNFMDGIDGIAAIESAFYFTAMALLMHQIDQTHELVLYCLILTSLSLGFLCWNWAPAKVFLGDSGSLFFGLLMAGVAMLAHTDGVVHLSVSLLLLAAFLTDSLVALAQRCIAGENIATAHRSHIYQLLARRWNSHPKVVLAYLLLNVSVLLPIAYIAHINSAQRAILLVGSYAVLGSIAAFLRIRLLRAE